jgi:very-short-patch-repair endonuclease
LKNKKFFGCLFNRQAIIGDYIVDFFCRQERAIVEIDGETHDGKGEYDKVRDNYLKGQGFTVIHIHDYEVKTNIEGVLAYIRKNMLTRTSTEVVSRY